MMTASRSLLTVLTILVLLAPSTQAHAQEPLAVGSEFQVNTLTALYQENPAVAIGTTGNFIVTWATYDGSSEDSDIQGQIFSAEGDKIGGEFPVNDFTTGQQFHPAVSAGPNGTFIIVWDSNGPKPGTDDASIQGQRFASDGSKLGSAFLINSYTTDQQAKATIAQDASGGFVVAWESRGSPGDDAHFDSIQARRFASDGSPLGEQFQVNESPTSFQRDSTIAVDPDGGFVVAWESEVSPGSDTDGRSVLARAFAADGTDLGGEFQVNTYTTGHQENPAIAMDDSGAFVVVWNDFELWGQRFASDGSPEGGEFQISAFTSGSLSLPEVAMSDAGDFVATWRSRNDDFEDDGEGIRGQRFASDGSMLGARFQINTYTPNLQTVPVIAMDGAGDFVAVWESDGSSDDDSDFSSVQAQRYRVTGDIGDRVWFDSNADGIQDGGEPGVPGVRVNLLDDLSILVAWTLTDAQGAYLFEVNDAGDYILEFEAPAIYAFTTQNQGADVTADSDADPATGQTVGLTVDIGVDVADWDAGLIAHLGLIFEDDFESGNTSAWGSSLP